MAGKKTNTRLAGDKIVKLNPDDVLDTVDCDGDPLELLRAGFSECDIEEDPQEIVRNIRDRNC